MRLLHTSTFELQSFFHAESRPPYVAVSHRWQEGQVSYSDFVSDRETAIASDCFSFVANACRAAKRDGIDYIWVYALCVDQSSSAEVNEAANSSFHWLRDSQHLIAHLDDLPPVGDKEYDEAIWGNCAWFTRCWTLPELLAPASVHFYDQHWNFRGCKTSPPLRHLVSRITHIISDVLCDSSLIPHVSLAKRMSWAAKRSTSREEDKAYSLIGIFNVNILVLYGEGAKAYMRLLEEILKNTQDLSILLWDAQPGDDSRQWRGVLANSPAEYWRWISCPPSWSNPLIFKGDMVFTSKGMAIRGHYLHNPQSRGLGLLLDLGSHDGTLHRRAVLMLFKLGDGYIRPAVGAAVSLATENMKNAIPLSVTVKRDIDLKSSITASNTLQLPSIPVPAARATVSPATSSPPAQDLQAQAISPGSQADIQRQSPQCDDRDSTESSADASEFCAFSLEVKSLESESFLGVSRTQRKRRRDLPEWQPPTQKRPKMLHAHPNRPWNRPLQSFPRGIVGEVSTRKYDLNGAQEDDSADSEVYHTLLEEDETEPTPVLEPNHEFRGLVPDIVQISQQAFFVWKSDNQRFIIHKDSSIEARPPCPAIPRFACHLCVSNMTLYRQFITRCELITMFDVQKHLATHRLAPYCPICYQTFSGASARDEHIIRRKCKLRTPPAHDGVSEEQLRLIAKVSGSSTPEEPWYKIWDILCPDKPRPPSPYLPGDVGLEISLMRDFWSEQGQIVVSGFLKSRGMLSWHMPAEERSLSALYSLVLDNLIDGIYEKYGSSYVRDASTQGPGKPGLAFGSRAIAGVWRPLKRWLPLHQPPTSTLEARNDPPPLDKEKENSTTQPSETVLAITAEER